MGERHELDFYESPWWFTTEALKAVKLEGVILEVCAGGGAIASLLKHLPNTLIFTNDIDPNKKADFHFDATLPLDKLPECDWIITNPPYADKAAPVVKNAYNHAKKGIVMFLLSSFLEPCSDRADFLSKHPPTTVLSYPRYCFRKDKSGKRWATDNGTINCFIWDKSASQQIIKIIPQDSIEGFYKNPSQDIGLEKAITILQDNIFWLREGDRVCHVKDHSWYGTVTQIDTNLIPSGVTTCQVLWDAVVFAGGTETDTQWTNKLILVQKETQY